MDASIDSLREVHIDLPAVIVSIDGVVSDVKARLQSEVDRMRQPICDRAAEQLSSLFDKIQGTCVSDVLLKREIEIAVATLVRNEVRRQFGKAIRACVKESIDSEMERINVAAAVREVARRIAEPDT